jgi:nucleoside-diphosphate-sugar epimerase
MSFVVRKANQMSLHHTSYVLRLSSFVLSPGSWLLVPGSQNFPSPTKTLLILLLHIIEPEFMNILITGGAGYIGTELVFELSQRPDIDNIVVYDNLSRGNYNLFLGKGPRQSNVKFIHGDILDSRSIRKALKGIDVVYHLAAKVTTPFANIDSHFFEQINHWGTAELVYAIEESDIEKFIFTSSASIYGSSNIPATEDTPPNPSSFYGVSKQRAEEHVKTDLRKRTYAHPSLRQCVRL